MSTLLKPAYEFSTGEAVDAFARRYDARFQWEVPGPKGTGIAAIRLYSIPHSSRCLTFFLYSGHNGWDVHTQPTLANSIDETVTAMNALQREHG